MEQNIYSKSSYNPHKKASENSKKKWVNTHSKQVQAPIQGKNQEFEVSSREDLTLTLNEKNEREARALAFLKELSERDDITNTSLEEKFNDFGFSMQSSKLLKRPKKSRENASCSKRNSRPTIIHNRLESLKREEIHNVGALRATTHEHFAPYNRKMLVKGSNNELLERSFTDKERLEEYINLETNGEYDTQREDVRGTLLKSGLIKGGKETNYQSIFTTSVKELRKKLSRQFLKSKSKAFLLGRKALNVSDVKGGEVMKKVEQQQVLGEVVLHGKSFGVSRLEKSKCYPYKTSLHGGETNETKEDMTTKRDFDEGNRFLTGDDLHRSILIKKIDGHKQGLQDILQTASATKIPTGLRTNFNDFDIENNLDKEVFDAATRKFWKDLESLSSRSKSSPRKLKKVQENEVKEQDKNNGKEEVLKEKGQEEVGINSARNHKYIRKVSMKRLGTEINGKSAPIIKVSKDKNKEAKENLIKENLEELYCKLSQRDGDCLNPLNFGNSSEVSTAPMTKVEAGPKLPIIHSLKFQESSLAKFVIKNGENRSKSIGSFTQRPSINEPHNMNVSKEFNDIKLVGAQMCQPATHRETQLIKKKSKKKSVIHNKLPTHREGYSVYPVRELINQDSELIGFKPGPTLAPLYSWDALSLRGSIC